MIIEKTLDNGFELIVAPTQSPVAAVHVWVDVGSIDERSDQAGYCHFLEHMLFKGTAKRSTQEIAGTVEGSGGDMNAFTSFEHTVYHITLAADRWKIANEILFDMVLHSEFFPKEFSPEKEVILEEIKRSDDSPDRQLYQGIYSMLYGKAGYGRPVIGFPKTVAACTPQALKSFWKSWYSPGLMTLVVCGNVDPKEVEREAIRTWGRGGKTQVKMNRQRRRNVPTAGRVFSKPSKMFQSRPYDISSLRWLSAVPACSMLSPDLPALDMATMILGHGETSRLHDALFRKQGLVTSVGASLWAQSGPGSLMLDAEVPVEKAKGFQESVWREVEKLCSEGPTHEELERVRVGIETDRVYSVQSMDGYANRLGFLKNVTGNVRFDLEYLSAVRELTLEDVRQVAQKYLIEGRESGELREFGLVPKGFDSNALSEGMLVKSGSVAKKPSAFKKAMVAVERFSIGDSVEVVLIPRRDLPIVSVQVCATGGLRAENEVNSGIGNILADVWEQGPKGWDALKFSQFLEDKGARVDAFSGRNSLGASATMLTPRIDEVLPIFCELLNEPAFSEHEIERSKSVALEDIRGMADDGGRLCGRRFSEVMFGEHPYALPITGKKESVAAIHRENVQKHYATTFLNNRKVISICGRFEPSKIMRILEKDLLKRKVVAGEKEKLSLDFPKGPRLVEEKKMREQSHVIVGYLGTTIADPSRYDLRVLQTILGGQSGRLFREIRDKRGFCYTVAPISFEGIEPGYFGVYIGCDPAKREQAIDAIHDELKKISQSKVSNGELARAKEYIYGRNNMEMQMTGSVALTVAFNVLYGLPFDEHEKLGENLKKVSAQSVQKLARRILSQPSVTSIVV